MYKVGIFGTGNLAIIHLKHWNALPGVSVAGFYDPGSEEITELERTYHIKRYTAEEELIGECDLVDVVCAPPCRFAICEKAIRQGKHVFVDKPMAHTMSEAGQLVKLVQESKVKLHVGGMERFNPAFRSLGDLQLKPLYIEARRMDAPDPKSTEVDVILDLMIHDIDMVLSVVNSEVKQVSASGVAVVTDTPDIANARIEFDNGCVATLTASRISMKPVHEMRLFQKDVYVALDFSNIGVKIFQAPGSVESILSSSAIELPRRPGVNTARQELQEFLAAVRDNTRTAVNEIDGYRAMEVAHQVLQKITDKLSVAR
ncbi:MAG TPA: Gfo/Idh/MocA family oxidoreductase [Chitinophagaceae bacterium]